MGASHARPKVQGSPHYCRDCSTRNTEATPVQIVEVTRDWSIVEWLCVPCQDKRRASGWMVSPYKPSEGAPPAPRERAKTASPAARPSDQRPRAPIQRAPNPTRDPRLTRMFELRKQGVPLARALEIVDAEEKDQCRNPAPTISGS